jgi:hypothetical protein
MFQYPSFLVLFSSFSVCSSILTAVTRVGGIILGYSDDAICVRADYTCGDYDSATVPISIPSSAAGKPLMMYMGLTGFYSAYLGLRSSISTTQLQASPRSASYLPYSGCSPVETLLDVDDVPNPYVPIDAFATDPAWKTKFDLAEINKKTLRPCGALFYWIPTDTYRMLDKNSAEVSQSHTNLSWDDLNIPAEPSGQQFPYVDVETDEFVWADPSTQRFRAWMRANIGASFVVKTGEFSSGLTAGDYTVEVTNCRDLQSEKFIEVCTTTWIGVNQTFLAAIFFATASILVVAAVAFLILTRYRRFVARR